MYKLVGPKGEVTLSEGEIRRFLGLVSNQLITNQRLVGLTMTELSLTEAVAQFRRLHQEVHI